jgi:integrase/recombinase XerD
MSIEIRSENRKGKRIVLELGITSSTGQSQHNKEKINIKEAFDLFISVKEAENVKSRTKKEYYVQFNNFDNWLQVYFSDIHYIQEITPSIIRSYVSYLAYDKTKYGGVNHRDQNTKGLSPYTVNISIRFLKCWFNVLVKEQVNLVSPTKNIKLMKVEYDTKQPISEDELRLLLQQPSHRSYAQFRDYIMMLLFVDSGMRVQEVSSLDIEDIDFQSKIINLSAIKNKNRKSRIIPISNEVLRLLHELIIETKQHFQSDALFISNFGDRLTSDGIRTNLKKYAKRAGLKKAVSPHAFRRFYAKHSALNGMDLFSLQRILGHADISTTRRYIQLENEDLILQHNQYSPLANVLKKKK